MGSSGLGMVRELDATTNGGRCVCVAVVCDLAGSRLWGIFRRTDGGESAVS